MKLTRRNFLKSCTLRAKRCFPQEWFAKFDLYGIDLLMEDDKMIGSLLLFLTDLCNRVVRLGDTTAGIVQFNAIAFVFRRGKIGFAAKLYMCNLLWQIMFWLPVPLLTV